MSHYISIFFCCTFSLKMILERFKIVKLNLYKAAFTNTHTPTHTRHKEKLHPFYKGLLAKSLGSALSKGKISDYRHFVEV